MRTPYKKKLIPVYDSKSVMATVVFDPATNRKRLQIDHQNYYQHEINQYALGDKIHLTMTNKKRKRTEAQNRYMHLYFSLIAMSSGNTTKRIKTWAKGKFLTEGITEVFGDRVREVTETHELKVLEMIEFIMRVEEHTGVPAPDPAPFAIGPSMAVWRKLKAEQRARYLKFQPKLD